MSGRNKKKKLLLKSPIITYLIGDTNNFSIENRIYNLSSLIIVVVTIPAFIWNASIQLPFFLNLIVVIFFLAFSMIYYFARFKKIYNSLIFVLASLIGISFIWITSHGSKGPAPLFFILAIVGFIAISNSKRHLLYLSITILNIVILFVLEKLFYDELIIGYPSPELKEMDTIFSIVVSLFTCFFLISVFKRIHEREKSVIEIQKKELQALNNTKDKFFSIIAHDLRNPFNLFLGLTEILDKKSASISTDELQILTKTINSTAKETYNLLENLLHWARVQGDTISFEPTTLFLRPLVERIINMNKTHYEKKNIRVHVNIPINFIVFADSNMLTSIIGNLITNALKFTNNNGLVIVTAIINEADMVEISVKDNGIGMEQKILENLFKIDVKINRVGTDGESITGLGLLLCHEFVQQHNGEIWAKSTVNNGSTFSFTLPSESETLHN